MARHHESPAPEVRGAVTRETTEGCRASPQCPVRRSFAGHLVPIPSLHPTQSLPHRENGGPQRAVALERARVGVDVVGDCERPETLNRCVPTNVPTTREPPGSGYFRHRAADLRKRPFGRCPFPSLPPLFRFPNPIARATSTSGIGRQERCSIQSARSSGAYCPSNCPTIEPDLVQLSRRAGQ
jgi:hypothetical protein